MGAMRAALLSIPLLFACGGPHAKEPQPRPLPDHPDYAGPKAEKMRQQPASSGPEPEQEVPTKKTTPDAVEAGPAVYKVALENEKVRVLVANYQPGSKVPMHRHPDHVVFALTGGARVSGDEMTVVDDALALFERAGKHEVEVAGPTATRAILVELGAKRGSAVPAGDEPVAKYPRTFKLLIDEARVRVLAVTFGKGRSRPVALGDHVLLSRDKGTLVVEPRGGSAQKLELEPGEVLFLPAGIYTAINSKKESFEVVLFELEP